ncbi:hypothetical protein BN946_scf184685.g5 [Trametes cinnabarina]|uniref:Nephrocystin 3-like N-terminal domain-containing protein n=1 Tax=Pycnoporus cinnabarinus TaxID=5643 RepID=A0A060SVC4_PYCCI|nr:hypothetical protein BN946_scf184685.g5 [Trametes cinnabarina]
MTLLCMKNPFAKRPRLSDNASHSSDSSPPPPHGPHQPPRGAEVQVLRKKNCSFLARFRPCSRWRSKKHPDPGPASDVVPTTGTLPQLSTVDQEQDRSLNLSFRRGALEGEARSTQSTQSDDQRQPSPQTRDQDEQPLKPQPASGPSQEQHVSGLVAPSNGSQPGTSKHRFPETLFNGIKLALTVTEKAGAAFPPLQAVAGSLCAIIEAVQKVSSNEADIRTLTDHINRLNFVISPESATLPPTEQWPAAFRDRLSEFERNLHKLEDDLKVLASETLQRKFLNAQERAGKIGSFVRSLAWLIRCFTVGELISIEFGVDRIEIKLREGLQHLDGRFDEVHTHLDRGLAQVHEHMDLMQETISQVSNQAAAVRFSPGVLVSMTDRALFWQQFQCEAETRKEALATIYSWIQPDDRELPTSSTPAMSASDSDRHPVMWIHALAGVGKTTLAQTAAQWCDDRRLLAASFFCARDGDRSNVQAIMPTIAF